MATKPKPVQQNEVVGTAQPEMPAATGPEAEAPAEVNVDAAPVADPVATFTEPPEQPELVETVKALVLVDCIYGKCGEVAEFAADQAEAIRAAGYIDTHPNAVASAG